MNYKDTLLMPKTDFPMRGLPNKEPQIKNNGKLTINTKSIRKIKVTNLTSYMMDHRMRMVICIWGMLNKNHYIIVRYKTMQGFYAPYVPGWDTHDTN